MRTHGKPRYYRTVESGQRASQMDGYKVIGHSFRTATNQNIVYIKSPKFTPPRLFRLYTRVNDIIPYSVLPNGQNEKVAPPSKLATFKCPRSRQTLTSITHHYPSSSSIIINSAHPPPGPNLRYSTRTRRKN